MLNEHKKLIEQLTNSQIDGELNEKCLIYANI